MQLIHCDNAFADQVLAIFNDTIATSTARYEYQPRTSRMIADWFDAKARGRWPVLGVVSETGELLGFGTYGPFRDMPGYKYTVEHSIYIHKDHRGQGIGKRLLQALIDTARTQDYHTLVAVIDAQNAASIAMHQRFGFREAGSLQQVGFKFGRWLDVVFYQLLLDTPARPVEG